MKSSNNIVLSLDGVFVKYENSNFDQFVLNNVSFKLSEKSGIIALVGPNGSGKTTILRAITGQIPLTKGTIILNGVNVSNVPSHKRTGLGCVFQRALEGMCSSLTIEENLSLMLMNSKPSILKPLVYNSRRENILEHAKKVLTDSNINTGILASINNVFK